MKNLIYIVLFLTYSYNALYAQHEAEFKTQTLIWNDIHFEIAEESQVLTNTPKSLILQVQQQELQIVKQKAKKQHLEAWKKNFIKKYALDSANVYDKSTAYFNSFYSFKNKAQLFSIVLLLQKKHKPQEVYFLEMQMPKMAGELTPEVLDSLRFMVEKIIEKLKL